MRVVYNHFNLTAAPYFVTAITGTDGVRASYATTKGVGQYGSTVTGKTVEEREISITGIIRADTKEELQEVKLSMLELFNPEKPGLLRYECGGTEREISVNVEKAPVFSSEEVWTVKKYTVALLACNPFWRDVKKERKEIALWKGNFFFPLSLPSGGAIMGYKQPDLIAKVYNKGALPTGMIIKFFARGTLENPLLYDVIKRKKLEINKRMIAGEEITINTNFGEKSAVSYCNGTETNIMHLLKIYEDDFDFLYLEPGQNLFRYDAGKGAANLEINIYYNSLYLGV